MADWTEYQDAYEIRLHRTNPHNIQEVETDGGIIIAFGEEPSKSKSSKFKLMSVVFLKEYWTLEEAQDWWIDHLICFVPKSHRGKKVPYIDLLIDDGKYYILACLRGTPKNDTIAHVLKESI